MTTPHLTRSRVRDLMERYELAPSRALGQNFLCDGGTVDKIVRLSRVSAGDPVIEIGPGLGSLTIGLARAGARVVALEIDQYLLPALGEVVAEYDVTIHHVDAREFDWSTHLGDESWTVVANLPYNIATPLLLDLLAARPELTRYLVMVQREAGERLAAGPGSRTYGIPSVLAGYWAEVTVVGTVRAELFWPKPKVESVLVEMVRHPKPAADAPFDRVAQLVRAGFGKRRKMLRGALAGLVTVEQLEQAGIAPTARAEELGLSAWGSLARVAP